MRIEITSLKKRLGDLRAELERTRDECVRAVAETGRLTERRTRERIMQLVHDEALQSLLAARQDLAAAARGRGTHDPAARACEAVQRAIRELREAIGGLHPLAVDSGRLEETVRVVAGRAATAAGLSVIFAITADAHEDYAPLLVSVVRELRERRPARARVSGARLLRSDGDERCWRYATTAWGSRRDVRRRRSWRGTSVWPGGASVRRWCWPVRARERAGPRHCARVTLPGRRSDGGEAGFALCDGRRPTLTEVAFHCGSILLVRSAVRSA